MKLNLNKLFPFLSIRKKMVIAFSLLSFVPLVIIGMIGIYSNINSMYKTAMGNLEHNVVMFKEKAQNFLLSVHLDIQLMCDSPIFRQYLKDVDDNGVQGTSELLTEQLLTFAKMKKNLLSTSFL